MWTIGGLLFMTLPQVYGFTYPHHKHAVSVSSVVSVVSTTFNNNNHYMSLYKYNQKINKTYDSKPLTTITKTQKSSLLMMSTTPSSNSHKSSTSSPSTITSVLSTSTFILLDIFFRKLFKSFHITSFPSSLGGCGVLFTLLTTLYMVKVDLGNGLYNLLKPGSYVLAKWLPVFFVPSLVTLPLAPSLGSSLEVSLVFYK